MTKEKVMLLEGIEPAEFYGAQNVNLDKIRSLFPKLKIIGRGNELKVIGDEEQTADFVNKMEKLVDYYHHYNRLDKDIIQMSLTEGEHTSKRKKSKKDDLILYGINGRPIKVKNDSQRKLLDLARKNDLVFASGPAGSGKTYIAVAMAVSALKNKEVRRIILTRPAVEAGENLGFLPGDLKEKIDPYLQPLYDALGDMIPAARLKEYFENDVIQIAPLAYMRGRTLSDAYVVLDEAQNTTANQLRMFLTRMGENAKFIVTGDLTQIDLPSRQTSGLEHGIKILKNIQGIAFIHFTARDIVRHRLVIDIVNAYEKL